MKKIWEKPAFVNWEIPVCWHNKTFPNVNSNMYPVNQRKIFEDQHNEFVYFIYFPSSISLNIFCIISVQRPSQIKVTVSLRIGFCPLFLWAWMKFNYLDTSVLLFVFLKKKKSYPERLTGCFLRSHWVCGPCSHLPPSGHTRVLRKRLPWLHRYSYEATKNKNINGC